MVRDKVLCITGIHPYSTCVLSHPCHVWLCATLRTVACQAPLSMGLLQARRLDWIAKSPFRRSSQPRDWTCIFCDSCTAGGFFTSEPLGIPLPYFLPSFPLTGVCVCAHMFMHAHTSLSIFGLILMWNIGSNLNGLVSAVASYFSWHHLLNTLSLPIDVMLSLANIWITSCTSICQ